MHLRHAAHDAFAQTETKREVLQVHWRGHHHDVRQTIVDKGDRHLLRNPVYDRGDVTILPALHRVLSLGSGKTGMVVHRASIAPHPNTGPATVAAGAIDQPP